MDINNKAIRKNTAFIATVYNEADTIRPFLESLAGQSVLPAEIVIVDGGSTDGTVKIIKSCFRDFSLPVRVNIIQEEAGISRGRNIAIKAARSEVICVSDAGCILDRDWLGTLASNAGPDTVAGGYSAALANSFLERCLASAVVVLPHQVKEDRFMPSSRNVCFYKSAWERVGGYPQNLDFGEDMKFNFFLKNQGYRIKFVPRAVVRWLMRTSLSSIFKQFFRYAKGDALGRMYTYRHGLRIGSAAVFLAFLTLIFTVSWWFLLPLALLLLVYSRPAFFRVGYVFEGRRCCKKAAAIMLLPFLLAYIDLAKLCGYFYGLAIRRRI
ncbi:MAG: glycosyltransferase [Actinomycetia bacterium]|nr:glycosyltransferase [Actinomycetes bacterium]